MQGAMPLERKPFSWCTRVNVAPYASATLELPFYFPLPSASPSAYHQFPVRMLGHLNKDISAIVTDPVLSVSTAGAGDRQSGQPSGGGGGSCGAAGRAAKWPCRRRGPRDGLRLGPLQPHSLGRGVCCLKACQNHCRTHALSLQNCREVSTKQSPMPLLSPSTPAINCVDAHHVAKRAGFRI